MLVVESIFTSFIRRFSGSSLGSSFGFKATFASLQLASLLPHTRAINLEMGAKAWPGTLTQAIFANLAPWSKGNWSTKIGGTCLL